MGSNEWRTESMRTAASFDAIADLYRHEFADELDRKPFDRALLDRFCSRVHRKEPVLEVGAGPAHIGGFLAERGIELIASDLSAGQMREAKALGLVTRLALCDMASLPFGPATLGGLVAFYCLIYGPASELDEVFAEWRTVLSSDGLVLASFHAGTGEISVSEWRGRSVDMTVVLREPEDVSSRFERAGFVVEECTTREPYGDEHPTERGYVVARRNS